MESGLECCLAEADDRRPHLTGSKLPLQCARNENYGDCMTHMMIVVALLDGVPNDQRQVS